MPTANEPKSKVEQAVSNEEQSAPFQGAHKIFLSFIGACALAVEEIEALVDRLIERGEIAEQDARRQLRKGMDRPKQGARKVEGAASRQAGKIVNRMTPVSKADIETLNEKINQLSGQIEDLRKGGKRAA